VEDAGVLNRDFIAFSSAAVLSQGVVSTHTNVFLVSIDNVYRC